MDHVVCLGARITGFFDMYFSFILGLKHEDSEQREHIVPTKTNPLILYQLAELELDSQYYGGYL